jgi:hypothetical protein
MSAPGWAPDTILSTKTKALFDPAAILHENHQQLGLGLFSLEERLLCLVVI